MKNIKLIFPSTEECWGRVVDTIYSRTTNTTDVVIEYDLPSGGTSKIIIDWHQITLSNCIDITRVYEVYV